jgi:hypothetical protein
MTTELPPSHAKEADDTAAERLPRLTTSRKVVLLARLFWVVGRILLSEGRFAIACLLMGTSRKEVRRQMRLRELTGDYRHRR